MSDRNEIVEGLWVGSHYETRPAGIDIVVLCARQLQDVPYVASRCPLTDDAWEIVKGDTDRAERTAAFVAGAIRDGKTVMLTCREGMNRSGWVAALTLVELGMEPETAIKTVQAKRPGSLYNWHFQQHVRSKSKETT